MSHNACNPTVVFGIDEHHRSTAVRLFDEAFGQKLSVAIPSMSHRVDLFEAHFDMSKALGAICDGQLVGLAGYAAADGALTGKIRYRDLVSRLGLWGGSRAALILSLYEREAQEGELVMDGIAVDEQFRGRGVGSLLLSTLVDWARSSGYQTLRLDVIDTNPGARKLYDKTGFNPAKTESFEYLRGILGFGAATTMTYQLSDDAGAG